MEDGIQIIVYVLAGIFWIVASVLKANKKGQAKGTPVSIPSSPAEFEIEEFESIPETKAKMTRFEELQEEKNIHENKTAKLISDKKREVDTFLGRNPYLDSVEHREKKKRAAKLKLIVPEEKQNGTRFDTAEIDWTKAVIYSEILRPRF